MVELTIRVPEAVAPEIKMLAEKLAGMVTNDLEDDFLTIEETDLCVKNAIKTLQAERVIRSPRDFAWIMAVMNEHVLDDFDQNFTGLSFIGYLESIGIDDSPSVSTMYNYREIATGNFPMWEFSDDPTQKETTRRINVGRRFVNAYKVAKKALLEGDLEK